MKSIPSDPFDRVQVSDGIATPWGEWCCLVLRMLEASWTVVAAPNAGRCVSTCCG